MSIQNDLKMNQLKVQRPCFPARMSPEARQALSQRLFAIHSQIFDGVSPDAFHRYVVEPATRRTKIYLLTNGAGQDVGYLTFQQFDVQPSRRKHTVFRTEVGMLPAYRGKNTAMRVLSREITLQYFRSGFRRSWFLATPIHPNPYCVIVNQGLRIWPRPEKKTPAPVRRIMNQLSQALDLKAVDAHPYRRQVGWRVKLTPFEIERVRQRTDPASQFYLSQNPQFDQGDGMLILVPIAPAQGICLIHNSIRRAFRRWHRARQVTRAQSSPAQDVGVEI